MRQFRCASFGATFTLLLTACGGSESAALSAGTFGPDASDCHETCAISITGACCGCPAGCATGVPDGLCFDGLACDGGEK